MYHLEPSPGDSPDPERATEVAFTQNRAENEAGGRRPLSDRSWPYRAWNGSRSGRGGRWEQAALNDANEREHGVQIAGDVLRINAELGLIAADRRVLEAAFESPWPRVR